MVFIYYDNRHKSLGKKLAAYLTGKKIKVITEQKITSEDKKQALIENLKKSDWAILIFSQDINKSKKIIDFYDLLYETNTPLILFVVSDLEYSLSMQFLLDGNDWIDAHNVKFSDAANALLQLINNHQENIPQDTKKQNEKNKKQTLWAAALIIIFSAIIGTFIFYENKNKDKPHEISQDSVSLTNNKIIPNKDKLFIQYLTGTWHLSNYEDNIVRTPEEQASLNQEIERLRKNFILKLNENGTFQRSGFTQNIENGYWEADVQNKLLYMWPPNSQQKDRLVIQKLTSQDLVLVIATVDQQGNQIITTLTLKKAE